MFLLILEIFNVLFSRCRYVATAEPACHNSNKDFGSALRTVLEGILSLSQPLRTLQLGGSCRCFPGHLGLHVLSSFLMPYAMFMAQVHFAHCHAKHSSHDGGLGLSILLRSYRYSSCVRCTRPVASLPFTGPTAVPCSGARRAGAREALRSQSLPCCRGD